MGRDFRRDMCHVCILVDHIRIHVLVDDIRLHVLILTCLCAMHNTVSREVICSGHPMGQLRNHTECDQGQ